MKYTITMNRMFESRRLLFHLEILILSKILGELKVGLLSFLDKTLFLEKGFININLKDNQKFVYLRSLYSKVLDL